MIVIDASALLEILLRTDRAEQLTGRALDASERLDAPQLLDIEVANVMRRMVRRKAVTLTRAGQVFDDFAELVIVRHDHETLLARIWQLRNAMSAYDGAYVALAEALDAPLLTCDGKLARAHGHRATLEVIGPARGTFRMTIRPCAIARTRASKKILSGFADIFSATNIVLIFVNARHR